MCGGEIVCASGCGCIVHTHMMHMYVRTYVCACEYMQGMCACAKEEIGIILKESNEHSGNTRCSTYILQGLCTGVISTGI